MRYRKAFGTTSIARLCRVTPPTVGRWIDEGKLPSFTTAGGHRRVWDDDLAAFCRSHNIPLSPDLSAAGRARILVVDDDPAVRRLLVRLIAQDWPSAEAHEASDGFEAGRKITALVPQVVVLDWRLPGLDGLRVCRLIRTDETLKGARVLVISGFNQEATRREALRAGADDFLGKPFDLEHMKTKLARLLPAEERP